MENNNFKTAVMKLTVTPEVKEYISQFAWERHISMAEWMREAIEEKISQELKKRKILRSLNIKKQTQ